METATQPENSVHFESFELKLRTRGLYCNGMRLKIRGHPVDVLAILLEKPGELVTREELKKRLWPADTFVDFEQILNNSVVRLRDALEDRADSPRFIETLPRFGYRFIAPVERSAPNKHVVQFPPFAGSSSADSLAMDSTKRHRFSMQWIVWPGTVLIVIAFAALAYWYLHAQLPAPFISYYQQLTLDGRRKIPVGTDGTRIYLRLLEFGYGNLQVPVSGGKVTEFPIELPSGDHFPILVASDVSPDGANLLVRDQFRPGEGWKIWVVGTDGRAARYLTIRAVHVTWNHDGHSVLYTDANGNLYTISINGGEPRLLRGEDKSSKRMTGPMPSPDGTIMRYSKEAEFGKIFEMSADTSNPHEFLPGWNGSVPKCCGRWTADGQFYVFLAGTTLGKRGPGSPVLAQMWAVDERRGRIRQPIPEPVLLASGPLLWGSAISSRDGKKIFARGVSLRGELQRYEQASKRLEPYLGGISAEMPDFSRDGKFLAYISFPDGILWRANRDGSAPVQLTQPPFYPRNPRWSPDGTQILFADNTENRVDALYVVQSQGGTPKRLFPDDGSPQSLGDWSPDGKRVVYTTDQQFSSMRSDPSKVETRIVELATGKVNVLPKGPKGFYAPLWSPDGRYIAGESLDTTKLAIFDMRTGDWKYLLDSEDAKHHYWTGENIGCHYWSHDSRFIYFISWIQQKAGVYRVPVEGGKAELVFDLPDGFRGTGYYDYWMSLDPNDTPLIFRDVGTDEIYALTLERK